MRSTEPILVLRHKPFEHLGHFASVLKDCHVEHLYHDLGEPLSRKSYQALIIMGGPMSANDDSPGLRDELALIESTLADDKPLFGVCLGSQLIARALGATIFRNQELEIGWEPVWLTDAARTDPVFEGIASPTMFFHWHGETFDLPAGAEWLAYSDKCRHQAYRYGRKVYGIQFHPEVTAEMIEDWCAQPVNCGDVATLESPVDPYKYDARNSSRKMMESWLTLL